jgi:hypothetical protein
VKYLPALDLAKEVSEMPDLQTLVFGSNHSAMRKKTIEAVEDMSFENMFD